MIWFHFLYLKRNRFVIIELKYHATKRKLNTNSQPGKIKNKLKFEVAILLVITANSDNIAENSIANFPFLLIFNLNFMYYKNKIKVSIFKCLYSKDCIFLNFLNLLKFIEKPYFL